MSNKQKKRGTPTTQTVLPDKAVRHPSCPPKSTLESEPIPKHIQDRVEKILRERGFTSSSNKR